ncbi:putative nuclease HARBI1 [Eriocheir sinensis]|uniref:putative nuclease HARBI1 n=1 Tax=Eriocheir sinensis TaxID=95602 RepID=UPI0021CA68D2|nr:putative nuclease HARBI1 [Eriocheir sinensis]
MMAALQVFEELDVLEDAAGERVRLPRRIVKDRLDLFLTLTEEEFTSRFRISKQSARALLADLHLPEAADARGCPVPPHLQLLITLRWMATGDLHQTIGDCLDVSQQFVSSCSSHTVCAIAALYQRYVKFPGRHELGSIKTNFEAISGFPGVIGAIDCTHIPILSPGGQQAETYRSRKGFFSLNVQAVCGPDLTFYNIICRWPGSVHDSGIFANSSLYAQLQAGDYNGHLLGDSAYPLRPFLMTPVGNPSRPNEGRYNLAHAKTRNVIERAFGVWKRRFRCLAIPMRTSLDTTMATICSAAVLHNIALADRNEDMEDYDNDIINEEERLIEYAQNRHAGQRKRANMINNVFSNE